MSKITRFTQKLFGINAGSNQMSEFGSLYASYPTVPTRYSGTTITPALVQSLSNYLTGWNGAAIGGNSPAIEDLNALCYLFSYQLGYLLQQGIPEYDSGTTYYTNSICSYSGTLYISLVDTNLGNTPGSSPSYWSVFQSSKKNPTIQKFTGTATGVGALFTVSSANATVGATYTNNGATFTVLGTISAGTLLYCSYPSGSPASSGTLTKASGTGDSSITFSTYQVISTYTTPSNPAPLYLKITAVGAGGAGEGVGGVSFGGSMTAFGINGLVAMGGQAGGNNAGSGGSALLGSIGAIGVAYSGSPGAQGTTSLSGCGGNSIFGGGGVNFGGTTGAGYAAAANSGSGGGGAAEAGGGGAGGAVIAILNNPTTSYIYCVGTPGSSSGGSYVGGSGANGILLVEEFYQ